MELWTKTSPTGAYWNPTRVVSDNRIPTFGADTSTYVSVTITLLFRRAFKALMDQKGWEVPDILMEQQTAIVPSSTMLH
jgi:hypothetical protein